MKTNPKPGEVTDLLTSWQQGNTKAFNRLVMLVEPELHQIADRLMQRERQGHTLQATALVNEAFMALVHRNQVGLQNRVQFYRVAARAMRNVLIDRARRRSTEKRGSNPTKIPLSERVLPSIETDPEMLDFYDAMEAMGADYPRAKDALELRYFGGYTLKEVADQLEVSVATVKNDLKLAKAWIYRHLKSEETE